MQQLKGTWDLLLQWGCRVQVRQIRYEELLTAETYIAAWVQRQRIPDTPSNTSQPVSSAGCTCPLRMLAAWMDVQRYVRAGSTFVQNWMPARFRLWLEGPLLEDWYI